MHNCVRLPKTPLRASTCMLTSGVSMTVVDKVMAPPQLGREARSYIVHLYMHDLCADRSNQSVVQLTDCTFHQRRHDLHGQVGVRTRAAARRASALPPPRSRGAGAVLDGDAAGVNEASSADVPPSRAPVIDAGPPVTTNGSQASEGGTVDRACYNCLDSPFLDLHSPFTAWCAWATQLVDWVPPLQSSGSDSGLNRGRMLPFSLVQLHLNWYMRQCIELSSL